MVREGLQRDGGLCVSRAASAQAGAMASLFYYVSQLVLRLSYLQVAVAEQRIARRLRFVASVPRFPSIPTAVALLGHRWTVIDTLYGTVKLNPMVVRAGCARPGVILQGIGHRIGCCCASLRPRGRLPARAVNGAE